MQKQRTILGLLILLWLLGISATAEETKSPERLLQEAAELIDSAGKVLFPPSPEGLVSAEADYRKALENIDEVERLFGSKRETEEGREFFKSLAQFRVNCAVGLGMIYGLRQDESAAIEVMKGQLGPVERSGNVVWFGQLHKSLGDSYRNLQELHSAKNHYKTALESFEVGDKSDSSGFMRYARLAFFRCLEDLGEIEKAREQLALALKSAKEIKEESSREKALRECYFESAYFHIRQGDRLAGERDVRAILDLKMVKNSPLDRALYLLALYNTCFGAEREAERRVAIQEAGKELDRARSLGLSIPGGMEQTYLLARITEEAEEDDAERTLAHINRIDELHILSGTGGLSPAFQARFNLYRSQGRGGELLPQLKSYIDALSNPTYEDLRLHLLLIRELADLGSGEEALLRVGALEKQLENTGAKALLLEAIQLEGLLFTYYQLGDKAAERYEEALKLAQELGRKEAVQDIKVALFQVELSKPLYLQDKAKIKRSFEALLSSSDQGSRSFLDLSVFFSGYISGLVHQRNFQEAERMIDLFSEIATGRSATIDRFLLLTKSRLKYQMGRHDEADSEIEKLTQELAVTSDIRSRKPLINLVITWKIAAGNLSKSDPIFEELAEVEARSEGIQEKLDDNIFNATVAAYHGSTQEELKYLLKAEELLLSVRQTGNQLGLQSAYLDSAGRLYQDLVIRFLSEDRLDEAFAATERSLGLTLGTLFARAESDLLKEANADEKSSLDSLFAKRETLERQILSLDEIEADKVIGELSTTVARIDKILGLIAQRMESSGKLFSSTVDADFVRSKLKPKQALVRFFVTTGKSYVFLVAPGRPTQVAELESADVLMTKIGAYRRSVQLQSHTTSKLATELSSSLFGGLTELSEFEEIVIVPDGPLYLLPFSSLKFPNGKPLYDLALSILPSARCLSYVKQARAVHKDGDLTIFANPRFSIEPVSGALDESEAARTGATSAPVDLPGTAEEADLVRRLCQQNLKVKTFEREQASKDVLERLSSSGELKRSRVLHFATHGFTVPQDPRLSGLILSLVDENGGSSNGYLRLVDIYDLKLDADLVVLSACQTGLGTIRHGDGLLGLYQGFLTAGSRQVLTTLWSVDDTATAQFFEYFYSALMSGKSAKESLASAQQTMAESKKWSSPYYWAAFQLVSR